MAERSPRCGHYVDTTGICRRCEPDLWREWWYAAVWWDREDAAGEPLFEERIAR